MRMNLPPIILDLVPRAATLGPLQSDALACDLACYALRIPSPDAANAAPKSLVSEGRSAVLRTFDASARLKLACYHLATIGCNVPDDARRVFVDFGLHSKDAWLWTQLGRWGADKALARMALEYDFSLSTLPHPNKILLQCHAWMKANDMEAFIGRYAWVKLRAFAQANRFSIKDLEADLMERAVLCYYRAVPIYSGAYLRNHIRLSVKNRGKYLIAYYTAQSRARLMANPDGGYTNRVRTIEIAGENEVSAVDPEVERMAALHSLPGGAPSGESELRAMYVSVSQLIDRYRRKGRVLRRRALELMTLNNDREFVSYWNQTKRRKAPAYSVADAFASCAGAEEFFSAVRDYLDMPAGAFDGLLADLRN